MRTEDLNQVIDHIGPTNSQKREMLERLLGRQAQPTAKIGGKFKIALMAAVISLCSATAFAVSQTALFEEIFGNRVELVKDHLLFPLSSTEDERFRLTLEGVLSDPYRSTFIVSVEALHEQSERTLEQTQVEWTVQSVQPDIQARSTHVEELHALAEKNKTYYALGFMSLDRALTDDLQVTLTAGESNLAISVPTASTIETITVRVDERYYEQADYVPEAVVISPLSVTVTGVERNMRRQIPMPGVIIAFEDGTRVDVFKQRTGFSGSRFPEEGLTTVSAQFEHIVDIRTVRSVAVDGIEYRVSDGTR